jgi:hypothetical protein
MKIVDRKTFLQQPAGVLYCKYEPAGNFGELAIKGESLSNDWYYVELVNGRADCDNSGDFFDKIDMAEAGEDIRNDLECESRDGLYENEMFCIYDQEDLSQLIEKLTSLKNYTGSFNQTN